MILTQDDFLCRVRVLHNEKYDYSRVKYIGLYSKIDIICPEHGIFKQIANAHLIGEGCPACFKSTKNLGADFIKRAKLKYGDKYDYSEVKYVNSKTMVKITCPEHGEFEQTPTDHLKYKGCIKCSFSELGKSKRKSNIKFIEDANKVHRNKYQYSSSEYKSNRIKIKIICPEHGEFEQTPTSHLSGSGCPKCGLINNAKSRTKISEVFISEANETHKNTYTYPEINYINARTKIKILCKEHGEFLQIPDNHLSKKYGCPKCSSCGTSKQEIEVQEFISELQIPFEINNRTLLNGQELDIYIPSHNLAIEFNGLYWHNELNKDKNFHLNKTTQCEAKGIQLIHIFEDEWLHKSDICKSRLKNLLGLTENMVYGRKCEIKEVKSKECEIFLDMNHIQGNVSSSVRLGLYFGEELVGLMTFGGLRKSLGLTSKDDKYELVRFCNKVNTSVIGGADKLLKHFIKIYQPKEIISYADRRWSQGGLYEKLGFAFVHHSQPNYFYVINNMREHRFKYRKDILIKQGYDLTKTEHQIMLERGIYRIYDCGSKKWVLKL